MLNKKAQVFLKGLFCNPRTNWHKANFNLFSNCKKILDLGCGKGLFIGLAPEKIIGLDSSWLSLKECANKDYTVIKADALNLPFSEESFDGIHCADLIEHFSPPDLRRLLIEILRVLKVGGFLVIATPLPSKMFWDDVSHLRPYPPKALLSYFISDINKGEGTAPTYESLPYQVKFVKLMWRHTQLYQLPLCLCLNDYRMKLGSLIRPSSLLFMLSNIAFRLKVCHPKPEGYVILIQKL